MEEIWKKVNDDDYELFFQCPICEQQYESSDAAYDCRDSHNDPEFMEKYVDYDGAHYDDLKM